MIVIFKSIDQSVHYSYSVFISTIFPHDLYFIKTCKIWWILWINVSDLNRGDSGSCTVCTSFILWKIASFLFFLFWSPRHCFSAGNELSSSRLLLQTLSILLLFSIFSVLSCNTHKNRVGNVVTRVWISYQNEILGTLHFWKRSHSTDISKTVSDI